jgi:hypothetical protein
MLGRAADDWRARSRWLRLGCATGCCLAFAQTPRADAAEDIEFVAEHLAEVAMDNRYATLPVFGSLDEETGKWSSGVQGAWTSTRTGELSSSGVLFAVFFSYLPAHLTFDLGTVLTQRFLEPLFHEGIEANWVLSCQWQY